MKLEILFNDQAVNDSFVGAHGFACLLDRSILFDTGGDPRNLFRNMKKMGIDINVIEAVVISHDHNDHTGGLWEILKIRRGLRVYACPNFSKEFKNKVTVFGGALIEQESPLEIIRDIFTTGEMPGIYKDKSMPEQALAVKTEHGFSVITGCAHPEIVNILERVKSYFSLQEFYSVLGGFHLHDKSEKEINHIIAQFKSMNVKKAGPTHCSGNKAEELFAKEYADHFILAQAGQILNI